MGKSNTARHPEHGGDINMILGCFCSSGTWRLVRVDEKIQDSVVGDRVYTLGVVGEHLEAAKCWRLFVIVFVVLCEKV